MYSKSANKYFGLKFGVVILLSNEVDRQIQLVPYGQTI